MLVYGLALRRERGLPALTLLSCDNLQANGDTLRSLVLAFALRLRAPDRTLTAAETAAVREAALAGAAELGAVLRS